MIQKAKKILETDYIAFILIIFTLTGFSIAQPLFDLLSKNEVYFIANGFLTHQIIILVIALSIVIPLAPSLLIIFAYRINKKAGSAFFTVMCFSLFVLIILPIINKFSRSGYLEIALSCIISLFPAFLLYNKNSFLRKFLIWLSPSIIIFPIFFLFFSPVNKIIMPQNSSPQLKIKHNDIISSTSYPDIIFILFDEISLSYMVDERNNIDKEKFPHFHELSKTSYWMKNASSVANQTHQVVPPILSGRYYEKDKYPDLKNYPVNLFSLFNGTHRLNVTEVCSSLSPISNRKLDITTLVYDILIIYLHTITPENLSDNLPSITDNWNNFRKNPNKKKPNNSPSKKMEKFSQIVKSIFNREIILHDFIESLKKEEKPVLHFLHLLIPHKPLVYLPSGKRYDLGLGEQEIILTKNPEPMENISQLQRYLLQLQYADTILGKIIERIKHQNLFSNSIIIITSDHGTSFSSGKNTRYLENDNYAEVMSVPLFIKLPHQNNGTVINANVESVDILPSILDAIGIDPPSTIEGRSFFDAGYRSKKILRLQNKKDCLNIKATDFNRKKIEFVPKFRSYFDSGYDGFFRMVASKTIINKNINGIVEGQSNEYSLILKNTLNYNKVELKSPFRPSFIAGKIESKTNNIRNIELAVAINGIIGATTSTTKQGNFTFMINDVFFCEGSNEINFYIMNNKNREKRLLLLQ
ncbi:MAG TPA: sulfatase-like hydrolase/transferase [Spirochaetota bacterium]|nr:sulfatase-like hydrolase/transferase [Spirochaetota bacterium]